LDKGEKIVILDVRDKRKWDKGHINGAKHIYVGYLKDKLDEVPKDRPVIVYCGTSRSANLAASILKKNGYGKVYNVLGGMTAWKNAGYDVVK
jgi:hydroxyacylglutathione hydrolase